MGRGQGRIAGNTTAGGLLYTFGRREHPTSASSSLSATPSRTESLLGQLQASLASQRFKPEQLHSIARTASYWGPMRGEEAGSLETVIGHLDAITTDNELIWSARVSGSDSGDRHLYQGPHLKKAITAINQALKDTLVHRQEATNADFGPDLLNTTMVTHEVTRLMQSGRSAFDRQRDSAVSYPSDPWLQGKLSHPHLTPQLQALSLEEIGDRVAKSQLDTKIGLSWVLQSAAFEHLPLQQREGWRRERLAIPVAERLVNDSLYGSGPNMSGWWKSDFASTWSRTDREYGRDAALSRARQEAFASALSSRIVEHLREERLRAITPMNSKVGAAIIDHGRQVISEQMAGWLVGDEARIRAWLGGTSYRRLQEEFGKRRLRKNHSLADLLTEAGISAAIYAGEAGGFNAERQNRIERTLRQALASAD